MAAVELELDRERFVTRVEGRRAWDREGRRALDEQREREARPIARSRSPLRSRCVQASRGVRQIPIAPEEELLIDARRALDHPATAEHLRRTRPRIERLLGLLVHRYGARKARHIGAAKARLQARWAAALVNLNPIGRRLAAARRDQSQIP